MGGRDQYEANKAKAEKQKNNTQPMKLWWLRQRDPIARFTLYVALFTLALVGVGILQFVILNQTDETQQSIQRAFVTSYEIGILAITADDQSQAWKITPLLENAGNSSATNLHFRTMRMYWSPIWGMRKYAPNVQPGAANPDINEVQFTGMPEASITLAPHAKVPIASYVLTEKAVGMLRANMLATYVFGEAEYDDVFDNWHRSKFCFRLLGQTATVQDDYIGLAAAPGVQGEVVESTKAELGYRLCQRNNCTDKQCGPKPNRPANDRPAVTLVEKPRK